MRAIYFKLRQNSLMLWATLPMLVLAMLNPTVSLPHDIRNFVFVIDITQSMNVNDMRVDGRPASRLEFTRRLLGDTLGKLPCGTRVSIALFANAEVVPLFTPIEVCNNFGVLQDTLANLEWRMAWRGSSHLRLGLYSASSMLNTLKDPAQIVFLTDGDEAAPLNAINKIELSGLPGSGGWLLAGIGATQPSPVPKFNARNEVIGYWSLYATKVEPSQIVSEESTGKRDDSIASDPSEYYRSALREDYLKEVARDIGANYERTGSEEILLEALERLPPAGHDDTPVTIGWLFALLAGILVLAEHWPTGPSPRRIRPDRRP